MLHRLGPAPRSGPDLNAVIMQAEEYVVVANDHVMCVIHYWSKAPSISTAYIVRWNVELSSGYCVEWRACYGHLGQGRASPFAIFDDVTTNCYVYASRTLQ